MVKNVPYIRWAMAIHSRFYMVCGDCTVSSMSIPTTTFAWLPLDSFWVMVLSSEKVLWEACSWKQQLHSKFPKSSQSNCFRHPLVLYKVTYDAWERQPEWLLGQHWNQTVLPAIVVCFGVGGSCDKHVDVARLHWYSGCFMFFFLTNIFFCMNMLSCYIRHPMSQRMCATYWRRGEQVGPGVRLCALK